MDQTAGDDRSSSPAWSGSGASMVQESDSESESPMIMDDSSVEEEETTPFKEGAHNVTSAHDEALFRALSPLDPVTNIDRAGELVQLEVLSNLNMYLSEQEESVLLSHLQSVQGVDIDEIPAAPAHIVTLENAKKKRVRLANIIQTNPKTIPVLLGFLRDLRERICIIGNGGAGVAGFVFLLANEPQMLDLTLVWHGGNSDVNFKNAFALHLGITYEPHIEREFIKELGGNPKDDVRTIFVNKLKLYIPDKDMLGFRSAFAAHEGQLVDPKVGPERAHAVIGAALFDSAMSGGDGRQINVEAYSRYASRYNHSAIGEHDKMMLTAGARHAVAAFPELDLGFGCGGVKDRIARMAQLAGETLVISNQSWYPPSVLEFSVKHEAYHLNDESFFCGALRDGKMTDNNILDDTWINNPAQLWKQPKHRSDAADRVFDFLVHPDDGRAFIERFNAEVARGTPTPRTPVFPPEPGVDYIEDYLKLQFELQETAPLRYLQTWAFMNYEATLYAQVVRQKPSLGGPEYDTTSETFRERLNQLIEEQKDCQIDELFTSQMLRFEKRKRQHSQGQPTERPAPFLSSYP